jgi:hypothetical protein
MFSAIFLDAVWRHAYTLIFRTEGRHPAVQSQKPVFILVAFL